MSQRGINSAEERLPTFLTRDAAIVEYVRPVHHEIQQLLRVLWNVRWLKIVAGNFVIDCVRKDGLLKRIINVVIIKNLLDDDHGRHS